MNPVAANGNSFINKDNMFPYVHISSWEEKLLFMKQALIDIYQVRKDERLFDIFDKVVDTTVSLNHFEMALSQELNLRFLNLSDKLNPHAVAQSVRWKCQVTLNAKDPLDERYEIKFLPPDCDDSTCLYLHSFGDDRFLFVTIVGICMKDENLGNEPFDITRQYYNQHWAEMSLFRNGIRFADQLYYFFGAEESERKQLAKVVSSDSKKKEKGLTAWFFNEKPPGITSKSFIPVTLLRDYFGHLTKEKPGKCNARIKLGFSNIFLLENIEEENILIMNDIPNPIDPTKVMTDGCGLISMELARQIPYAIMQGNFHSLRSERMPLPTMIQIRCASAKGLFKGCLFITNDINLCPANCLIFRPSMLKSGPSPFYRPDQRPRPLFGIVRSFENALLLTSNKRQDKSDYSIRLNQQTCLLLNYLKVPYEYFEDLMQKELMTLINCLRSEEDAKKLVKQVLKSSKSIPVSPLKENQEDENELEEFEFYEDLNEESDLTIVLNTDNDEESTLQDYFNQQTKHQKPSDLDGDELSSYFDSFFLDEGNNLHHHDNHRNRLNDRIPVVNEQFYQEINSTSSSLFRKNSEKLSSAEQLQLFFLAGFSLQESFIRQEFDKIISLRYQHLLECRLQIRNSLYLVGAPDPYGFLEPDEVFIAFPNDRNEQKNVDFLDCKKLLGKVLVTRHPTNHPGDIRLLKAVSHPLLEQHSINISNGGVIVFSTKGERAAADQMSGGDYDGDLFLVCYNDEPGFLDHFQPVPPLVEEDEPAESISYHPLTEYACQHEVGTCRECWDQIGVSILRSLLLTAQRQCIGRYSNAWQKYADLDPLSKEALECAKISRIALDAAKTGKRIPENKKLILNAPIPHYLDSHYKERNQQAGYASSWHDHEEMEDPDDFLSSPSTLSSPVYSEVNPFPSQGNHNNNNNNNQRGSTGGNSRPSWGSQTSNSYSSPPSTRQSLPLSQQQGPSPSSGSYQSKKRSRSYHSLSILGRLYDLTQRVFLQYNQSAPATALKFNLNLLSPQGQQKTAASSSSASPQLIATSSSSSAIFFDFDCVVVLELDFQPSTSPLSNHPLAIPKEILKKYCASSSRSFRLYQTTEIKDHLYELFPAWIGYFDEYASQIKQFNQKLREILEHWGDKRINSFEKNKQIDDLRIQHYQRFVELVQSIYQSYQGQIPMKWIQLRLAGIVYLATYLLINPSAPAASQGPRPNQGNGKKNSFAAAEFAPSHSPLSYCWNLCPKELLYNKHQISLKRQQLSVFELLSPKEIAFWL
jgi:hypothetical protein